jgi:hypothetical protein
MNATPIEPPFVLQHAFMSFTYAEVRAQARFVRMPIPIYYANTFVAKIIGVGESGQEYVYDYETRNVYLGVDNYITFLDNKRPYPTRRSRETCVRSLFFCIHTKNITMGQWQDNLCGWGETPRGTVACIKNTLSFPEEPGEIREPPTPSRIIHLPEPPMRFGTLEDDSDTGEVMSDASLSDWDMNLPSMIDEETSKECTICYAEFTDNDPMAPCGHKEHRICSQCLARHSTNWTNHCVSANTPYVTCPHEGCTGSYSLRTVSTYVSANDFHKLSDKIQHFLQRQSAKVACPSCSQIQTLPSEAITDISPGQRNVHCTHCNHQFCYHCLRSTSANQVCMYCCNSIPSMASAGEYNRFVPKKGCVALIPRNYELTVGDCMQQLHFLATDPTLMNKCRACDVGIHRSSACAEISHCGLKQCTICGMTGLEFENHLIDHWADHGLGGTCPRWFSDPFWNQVLHSQCRCKEGHCHDDTHDCHVPEHEAYRNEVVEVRRLRHIKMLLRSLPTELRNLVISDILHLSDDNRIKQCLTTIKMAREYGALV